MKKNLGSADIFIRTTLGLLVFLIGYYYHSWWGLLGFVPLLTAWMGFCPLYRLFGISTCKRSQKT